MNTARQNYLEHEFFLAMRRNPDDPVREMLDHFEGLNLPRHQIRSYMEEIRDSAFLYFESQGRQDLIERYGFYSAIKQGAIA